MKILNKYKFTMQNVLKGFGIIFLVLVLLSFAMSFVFSPLLKNINSFTRSSLVNSPSYGGMMESSVAPKMATLSARNVMMSDDGIKHDYATGNDAENFEVTEYYAYIESSDIKNDCKIISNLKPLDYVIFENANQDENSCNFTFKAEKDWEKEILRILRNLKPKNLSENIHTIKSQIEDYTSESDILKKKQKSIEDTLEKATKTYNEISEFAREQKDTESLSKVIDSKLRTIERLTQDLINLNAQLERIERSKQIQLDKLKYTIFRVNIIEKKLLDFKKIKENWFSAIKYAIQDINEAIQGMSVNLITLAFLLIQYSLYFFILIFIAKLYWKWAKKILKNKKDKK